MSQVHRIANHRIRAAAVAGSLLVLCLTPRVGFGQIVVDSINANRSNANLVWTFASDVGWFYTPAVSYELVRIETRFGSGDARNITTQLFATSAFNVPDVSSPLASAVFQPVGNTFTGETFSSSVALTAGTQYFVGFRNVSGLRVNFTSEAGATNLGILRGSNNGTYSIIITGGGFDQGNYQPILRFLAPSSAAPEPSALALMAGIVAIGGWTVFRRRAARTRQRL